jgi:GxxExxY protein
MNHGDTEATGTHGDWRRLNQYRDAAVKARAQEVSGQTIGAAIEVHRQLGPGLLESVYGACLSDELRFRGIDHRQEVAVPVAYRGRTLDVGHRIDLLVEDLVIVELKAVERLEPVHQAQLLSYLRLSGRWLGLLVNFHTAVLTHGLRRVLNG